MYILRSFLMTIVVYCLFSTSIFGQEWKPLDPADLALKASVVEKDADAEALLWEVYLNDTDDHSTEFVHLIRIKIFTEKGKENLSRIDLPYMNDLSIRNVTGRVIKPDGTIVELNKDSVFDREIVKFGKLKLKVKTIAMPGLEPGSIIEYKYRETFKQNVHYRKLYFQRDIPAHVVRYFLKPHPRIPYPMRTYGNGFTGTPFEKLSNGFYKTEMKNVPAYKEEPNMPPEDQIKVWMLVYYEIEPGEKSPEVWWKKRGKKYYDEHKDKMKVGDEIRKAATEAIGDATAPEQKLERIFNYSREKVKDALDDASGLTAVQKETFIKNIKENRSPADTLKSGLGTGGDINFLFAAMATAAGFEARVIQLTDRSRIFFDPNFADTHFINSQSIAVKVGDQWKVFDPANEYVPFGMLRWQEEGIKALLCDAKESQFITTPLSTSDKSKTFRIARLKLSEDGEITGQVTITFTGHSANEKKEEYDEETPEARETLVKDELQQRLSTASATDIKIENVTDRIKPLIYSYKIQVDGYAERTGKRLFLQPAFFQKGIATLFRTSDRKNAIYFNHPWSEDDDIQIELPPGYELESPDAPTGFDHPPVAKYNVKLSVTKDKKILIYKRQFNFDGLLFPQTIYGDLKKLFDYIHKQDNHAITLKQSATN